MPLGFAAIAAVCLFASCSEQSTPNGEKLGSRGADAASEAVQNQDLLRPDAVLVVVRDIAGWWQDCGCTGTGIGGAGRLRAIAGNAKHVEFLFLGRTVLPYREGGSAAEESLSAASDWFAAVAVSVFTGLGVPSNRSQAA